MECIYCKGQCIKAGKYKMIQRFQCKNSKRYQQELYTKQRISQEKYDWARWLNNESCGISSIGRLLHISKSSVQRIIIRIASTLEIPVYQEINQSYQMDELRTYCGNKGNESWLMYAINQQTGKVIDFCIGRRRKENVKKVVDILLQLYPKKIHTDRLNLYSGLIPKTIHSVFQFSTNKIERYNLTLRTHLKRLSRKTICFTKNDFILECCVKLYFCKKQAVRET